MNKSDEQFVRSTMLPNAVKPYELSPEAKDFVPDISELNQAEIRVTHESRYMDSNRRLRSPLEQRTALADTIERMEKDLVTARYLQRIMIERELRGPGSWLRRLFGGES